MMQYNFRIRLEPNLFSGHFDKVGTIWPADVHTVHAGEWCKEQKQVAQPVWQV